MALIEQLVPVVLGARDGKQSPKLAVNGTLTRVENMRQRTKDRYEKRGGAARVTTLASNAGRRVIAVNAGQELLAWDTTTAYAKENTGAGAFVARNSVFNYLPRELEIGAAGRFTDAATLDGKIFVLDGFAGRLSVFESATGKVIARNVQVAGATVSASASHHSRILAVANRIVVLSVEISGAVSVVRGVTIDPATPTVIPAAYTAATTGAGVIAFDAIARGSDVEVVAFSGTVLYFGRFNPLTGVTSASRTKVAFLGAGTYSDHVLSFTDYDGSSGNLNVIWAYYEIFSATNKTAWGKFISIPLALNVDPVATTLISENDTAANVQKRFYRTITGWSDTNGTVTGLFERAEETISASAGVHVIWSRTRIMKAAKPSGGAVVTTEIVRSVSLASRTWTYDGSRFAVAHYPSNSAGNGYAAVMNIDTGICAARAFDGKTYGVFGVYGDGPNPFSDTATTDAYPVYNASSGVTIFGDTKLATPIVESSGARVIVPYAYKESTEWKISALALEADSTAVGAPKEVNGTAIIPGGVTRGFDGDSVTELGFHNQPEQPRATVTAGGSMDIGIFKAIVVLSWVDARGRVYESIPSIAARIASGASPNNQSLTTTAGNQSISIVADTYRFTDKRGVYGAKVRVDLYMTLVNPGTNPNYYFVESKENDTGADSVTFTVSNRPNAANKTLYIGGDGSVLENWGAPASIAVDVANSRVWLIAAADRQTVWTSKVIEEQIGIGFNGEVLTARIEDSYGDLTAIAAVSGDKIAFWKEDKIYGMWGDGPDNAGEGTFSNPTPLDTNIGTDTPVVAATGLGVLFRASGDKGFYLVDTNFAVTHMPELDDVTGKTLTDAVVDPRKHVAFIATSDGEVLCYDLTWRRWYIDTGRAARGVTVWQNKYTWIDSAGVIRQQDDTRWDDDGTNFVAAWESSWLSMKGLAGYGRTYSVDVLGDYVGAHHAKITAYLDFDTTNSTFWTKSFLAAPSRYHWRCKFPLRKQQHTAVKLRGEEYFSGNTPTAGMAFEALVFLIGIDQKKTILPSALKATNG